MRPAGPAAVLIALVAIGSALGGFALYRAHAPQPQPLRPEFSLADLDGMKRSVSEWDGKALVVNFWATWCAPCRREIPLLIELQQQYAARDLQVIGIAIDDRDAVQSYAEEMAIDYPLLVGDQDAVDVAHAFGLDLMALPMTAFTDRDGRVRQLHVGELHRDEAEAVLAELLGM